MSAGGPTSRVSRSGVLGLVLLLAPALVVGQQESSVVAFTRITVIPMEGPERVRDLNVIVREGRIAAMGHADSTPVPAGARVIDGRGRYLLPGLIDAHTHLTGPLELGLFLASGVTTVRVMAGSPGHLQLRNDIRAGRIEGPDLFVAGPQLHGPVRSAPTVANTRLVTTAGEGAAEVASQVEAGYDYIKVYGDLTAEAYRGIVEEAAKRGIPVTGHVPFDVGLAGVLAARQHSIEHLRGYEYALLSPESSLRAEPALRSRMIAWPHADEGSMADIAAATRRAGTWNCPTLVLRVLLPVDEVLAYFEKDEAAYLRTGAHGRRWLMDRSRVAWASTFSDADFDATLEGRRQRLQMVKALHDAGAGICVGTDAAVPGFSLLEEIALLRDAGLSSHEALRAATEGGAGVLGVHDRGVIAVGRRADLVLVGEDPLLSDAGLTRPEGVMTAGRWYGRDDLDRFLRNARTTEGGPIYAARPEAIDQPVLVTTGGHPVLSPHAEWLYYEAPPEQRTFLKSPGQNGQTKLEMVTEVRRIRLTGGAEETLARNVGPPGGAFSLSADGRTLAFSALDSAGTSLYALDLEQAEANPRLLYQARGIYEALAPRFSPVEDRIAFVAGGDLLQVSSAGGDPLLLATVRSWQPEIAWSPDGARLAAIGSPDGSSIVVYAVDVAGASRRRLSPASEDSWGKEGLTWDPAGMRLTYLCYYCTGVDEAGELGEQIRIVGESGRSEVWISRPITYEWPVGWTPDGKRYLFLVFSQEGTAVYERESVTEASFLFPVRSAPVWSADGRWIAWEGPAPPGI